MQFLPIIALAGAAYWWLNRKKAYGFQTIKGGVTGRSWDTRIVSIKGSGDDKEQVVEVWAPTGSWGPHHQLLVLTYRQRGSDKGSRQSISVGPHAQAAMVTAAGQDFGVQKPTTTVSGGPCPEAVMPIYEPRSKKHIGKVETFHDGSAWQWVASFKNGVPIAQGKSTTPARAHQNATASLVRRLHSDARKLAIVRSLDS